MLLIRLFSLNFVQQLSLFLQKFLQYIYFLGIYSNLNSSTAFISLSFKLKAIKLTYSHKFQHKQSKNANYLSRMLFPPNSRKAILINKKDQTLSIYKRVSNEYISLSLLHINIEIHHINHNTSAKIMLLYSFLLNSILKELKRLIEITKLLFISIKFLL